MRLFCIKPQIHKYDSFTGFASDFNPGEEDLIVSHEFIYDPYIKPLCLKSGFIFQEKYGAGEPSDEMIDDMLKDMGDVRYKRIIAVGGGSVIDIAKLMALKNMGNCLSLFEKRVQPVKERELILIPTTCGTGSEVTNISIAGIKERHIKMGLAADAMYADHAVLIPELLRGLPYKFFVSSSIDALIHAFESFVSPKSNSYTELYSTYAINMILKGYMRIVKYGEEYRYNMLESFLTASNFAGIAFSNTGVGAVHALSYPLGGSCHVPHGEANYQFFTRVFRMYERLKPDGKIKQLKEIILKTLGAAGADDVFEALEQLTGRLLPKNRLRDYGMRKQEIEMFTDNVIATQQRLLANNYVTLSRTHILNIYEDLY